jgi:hypothetical protein
VRSDGIIIVPTVTTKDYLAPNAYAQSRRRQKKQYAQNELTRNRHQTPRIQRDLLVQHRSQAVYDRRVHDADRRVQVPADLGASVGKVEGGRAGGGIDGDLQADLRRGEQRMSL